MTSQPVILTFSHLRWNFVYQRPQHLLSRLASRHSWKILFVEEPVRDSSQVLSWEYEQPAPGITVCRPHTPAEQPGFVDEQFPHLDRLLDGLLEEQQVKGYGLWFYTPMAMPLARRLQPEFVVYDCMDELSAFLGAPPQLLEREEELFQRADLVFTGGPSLYRAKKDRHPSVHCFPSSVDRAHFAQARRRMPEPPDQAALPHPRLGFFGVIDERLDIGLLDHLSQARPEWQIVMVGPTVKIDPAALPHRPNIHYVGQRSYQELPAYLAGWDVCLLPFARNDATRFISPTKTLEYMAANKLIVSTPITDVAEPYGKFVYLGETPEQFLDACERALNASRQERSERLARAEEVLARTSWDNTVDKMQTLLAGPAISPVHRKARTVIVGAGPTGLSAAYHLGADSLLLEQNDRVGGWCRSVEDRGFTFDCAGHIMFSNDEYVHQMYKMLLGTNIHWQDREAWIFSKGVYTRYPFQGALYGLPADVIQECIVGAIEARFGSLKAKKEAAMKANGKANGKTAAACITDCCADGILESETPLEARSEEPSNFEDFIYRVWGKGIAKHFAIPYNRKLWGLPLKDMETSWLGGRVPMPDIEEMIEGALKPVPKPMGPNARFGYPLVGGFQALMDGFLPHLKGDLRLNTRVTGISPARHKLQLSDGSEVTYDYLISTMPLPVLVRMLGEEAPDLVRAAARKLRHVSIRSVNIGVGRENLTDKHWIYYPEDTVFHRIFVQGNASPGCNAPGGFGLTCEISYSDHKPLPADGDALIQRCIDDCRRVGFIREDDPVWAANQIDLPYAYVVYDHARPKNVALIRHWLSKHDILLAGRYSEWEYYNSDHAFLAGKKAAERVRSLEKERTRERSSLGEGLLQDLGGLVAPELQ